MRPAPGTQTKVHLMRPNQEAARPPVPSQLPQSPCTSCPPGPHLRVLRDPVSHSEGAEAGEGGEAQRLQGGQLQAVHVPRQQVQRAQAGRQRLQAADQAAGCKVCG